LTSNQNRTIQMYYNILSSNPDENG
jgi:hypothetical protein